MNNTTVPAARLLQWNDDASRWECHDTRTTSVHPVVATVGVLCPLPPIAVARHPSTLLLSADGSRLFVASASTDGISVIGQRVRDLDPIKISDPLKLIEIAPAVSCARTP